MAKYQKIFLVDDDDVACFINQNLIEELGFATDVQPFTDAEEVFPYLNDSKTRPDLILLDLKMPVFDGFDFLEKFQHLSEDIRSSVKIVVLTTSENPKDRKRLAKLGYEKYLIKPLNKNKLETL
ncbi:CheY-like chemotaxis protein [Catalinimonas alkaloidigena]|uniref:response regulator n=1 Tax=Catalinimonas alkaloidigena TaxID=1075417 RepID=UPI002406A0AD|nr:response regulator [Catalinimonas alkaloidigena]MDF9797632.1 CheY-like chemotaxis protein [Catalinimonas alkaloidigena]